MCKVYRGFFELHENFVPKILYFIWNLITWIYLGVVLG